MAFFKEEINSWQDWGNVFQSIPAFAPLIEFIFKKEKLPFSKIENLEPGTNAVFKAGSYVIKIFAPAESGMDPAPGINTELFALRHVNRLGISAPALIADGFVEDRYNFAYMIFDFIDGIDFDNAVIKMTDDEKCDFGGRLRTITDSMNIPCESFNGIDVINDIDRSWRWDEYPGSFKRERDEYIKSHDYGERVFVHGDLCGDNILLKTPALGQPRDEIYIIDFADAVLAPVIYEHALVAVELFRFDPFLLQGYFGPCRLDELTDICFNGLLIHDFGGDIAEHYFGKPDEIKCLADFRKKIENALVEKAINYH